MQYSACNESRLDVAPHRQPRKEIWILENQTALSVWSSDRFRANQKVARVGSIEAGRETKRIVRCRETFPDVANHQRGRFNFSRRYHLITPFCQTRTRSRTLNRTVMIVEKNAAMMMSAAKTFPYSAHPCAQLTYHPSPDFTPTDSATTNVRNEAPNPINKPMKIFGTAAGIATWKIR